MTFFLIVFVVPVVLIALPLYARYTLYPAATLALLPKDTMDLHSLASSFWCQVGLYRYYKVHYLVTYPTHLQL